jgi:hypothetical protein
MALRVDAPESTATLQNYEIRVTGPVPADLLKELGISGQVEVAAQTVLHIPVSVPADLIGLILQLDGEDLQLVEIRTDR